MQQPLFSVVIPAYNRAHCIHSAISSVQKQTEQHFEIIVIDDGSSDGTEQVVAEISKDEPRLRFIKQENGGATKARNTGIKATVGRYIAFLDSDDVFLPHHLEQARLALGSNEKTCVYTQVIVHRGNNLEFVKPSRGPRPGEHISEYLFCNHGFVPTITLVVPTKLANEVLYDETVGYGDDMDFAIRLVAAGGDLIMLSKPSAIWQDIWSESRLSSAIDPVKRLSWLKTFEPLLTQKAYYAVLGRSVAKGYSQHGDKLRAFHYYFKSLFHGGFTPKSAVMYFFQITLSNNQYRKFSDALAKLGFRP
ncbi:glycosyltransferase family 2 protein [Shewanella sp. HL-SH5]|jgi:glycosyltransferase involved in cell wall biosynthesis|uniref:glycosyltransferase family 2 protein n=1 Tax=Shewanella sp. HL-SH5 TaxID=3436241 RepID=UPI003EC08C8E